MEESVCTRGLKGLRLTAGVGLLVLALDGVAFAQERDFTQVDATMANLVAAVARCGCPGSVR